MDNIKKMFTRETPIETPAWLDPLGRCKHGLMRCTCGVCTKHPLSVAVKGGHVVGSSSSSPTVITNPGFCAGG
jgi:hypothetical protein